MHGHSQCYASDVDDDASGVISIGSVMEVMLMMMQVVSSAFAVSGK